MMQVAHVKLTAEHPDLSVTEIPGLSLYAAMLEAEHRAAAGQRVTLQVTYTFGGSIVVAKTDSVGEG